LYDIHNKTVETNPAYAEVSSTGKELAILVKTDRHHTISGVECFFNAVSMMDVNVYVKYALVIPKNAKTNKMPPELAKHAGDDSTAGAPEFQAQYLDIFASGHERFDSREVWHKPFT
jgi:hypothetical protein